MTIYERVARLTHSGSTWSQQPNKKKCLLWNSFDHSMSDHPWWEIKYQQNLLSAQVVNFRPKQLDSLFTPKAEITRPADNSVIKNKSKKLKFRERTNKGVNNEIIMFLNRKRTTDDYEIIVVISMIHSP